MKKINDSKLPIKYLLEVHQELPGFPSHQDLEYCLLRSLEEKDLIGRSFKPEQVWYGFKNQLGRIDELRGFLEYLSNPDDQHDRLSFKVLLKKEPSGLYIVESHKWE